MKFSRTVLQLKFKLLAMTMLASLSATAWAQMKCSDVFTGIQGAVVSSQLITELARMKIQVDTLQVTGGAEDSAEFSVLRMEYDRLFQTLLSSSQMSEKAFRETIKESIRKIQNENNKTENKEAEARKVEIEHISKAPVYYQTDVISLDFAKNWKFATSKVSDAGEVLFITPKRDLISFNINSRDQKTILHLQTSNAQFMPDGKHVAVLAFDRHLSVYDPQSGKKVHEVKLDINVFMNRNDGRDFSKMEFSPDGKTLAFSGDNIVFFDVQTGKLINADPVMSVPTRLRYISNNEILYVQGYRIIKHNIQTNQKERYEVGTSLIYDFEVFQNNTRAAIFSANSNKHVIDTQKMTLIDQEPINREIFGSLQRMAADSDFSFVRTGNLSTLRLYDMGQNLPVFEFKDDQKDASTVFLDRTGATALFRRQSLGKETLQVWRIK